MAAAKFKMPTDKQIWAEVDEQLAKLSEPYKKVRGVPDRQNLFEQKKAWYQSAPQRLAADAKAKAAEKKKRADADAAYLSLRRAQGKPIVTVKTFKAQYPRVKEAVLKTYSQQKLHEAYDWIGFLSEAKAIQGRYIRLQAVTKALTYQHLAKTYGLYRRIVKSEVADIAFEEIRAMLWNEYTIKTHFDIPRSSLLLKLVFEGASEKTIHLYTRCIQLADGYDVEESDFTDFIKQLGGMEKIRKAYATVIGADAGTWRPAYIQDAENSASLNVLVGKQPFVAIQLGSGEGAAFHNDMFGYYCLVLAHIDPLDRLEIFLQLPSSKAIENDILSRITNKNRVTGTATWAEHKAKASALSAKRLQEKMTAKEEKQKAKEKKAASAAKKAASTEKRFARQRAASASATKPSAKPVVKSSSKKAVKK